LNVLASVTWPCAAVIIVHHPALASPSRGRASLRSVEYDPDATASFALDLK